MNERLVLKGRLTDARQRLKEMQLKAESYIIVLRDIYDPYSAEDITNIDAARGEVIARELNLLCQEASRLKEQIKKLEEALNG